ncbi:hypothetical protein K1719_047150 [Acacia pycnantha]|nr:hypothetical protein K1719_047150 [Acacia pycnantha]
MRERNICGRSRRSQKNVQKCAACPTNISNFLQNVQINRELISLIDSLKELAEQKRDSEDLKFENCFGKKADYIKTDVGEDDEIDSDECSKENEQEQ